MIGVYIRPKAMTIEQYKAIDQKVRSASGEPRGMKLHTCFGESDGIAIFDVWDTEDDFHAFAAVLGPIVAAAGVEPLEPMIVPMIAFETA